MQDLHELPSHLVRRMNQASVSMLIDETKAQGYDLTPVQCSALRAIGDRPGMDQATLANTLAHDRVTVGGVVERLMKKHLVLRKVSPADRRARELYLTEAGSRIAEQLSPILRHTQDLLLQGLDVQEREIFLRLLRKAADAVNDSSRAPLKLS